MRYFGSNESEERNIKVTRIVSCFGIESVVRTFGSACLSTYTEDRSTSLYQGVGRATAVSEHEVKTGMDGLSVTVSKNGLYLGHSNTLICSTAVHNIRIYVGIIALVCLKTCFANVSLCNANFSKLLGSRISKTYDYATFGVTVSADLLGIDWGADESVPLNVHAFYTDLTKGTKKSCI